MKGFSLEGRRALVTGAAQGIGRAIAFAFEEAGAEVLAHDRDTIKLDELTTDRNMTKIVADLGRPHEVERLAVDAKQYGPVDILVLCASIQKRLPWQEALAGIVDDELMVNFHATRILLAHFAPEMVRRGWGRILAIGSVQELMPRSDMMTYAALKSAQANIILALAKELAPSGVTCNLLSPGVIQTERNALVLADPNYRASITAAIPASRLGTPEDCVGPALLLCSSAGSYITGQRLGVDGGMSL